MDAAAVIVLTTLPVSADADGFARTLVEERLAACVGVYGEMRSVYRWNEAVESEPERQLVIKTSRSRLAALESRAASLHPYQIPEWLVLDPSGGSAAYLAWLANATMSGR